MIQHETHPWHCFVPPHSTVLFAGTFPPAKNRWSYNFFYPNKANLFWKIIAAVAGTDLKYFSGEEAVAERKQLLRSLHTGITDMGQQIIRRENSSLDENISIVQYMDILKILDENPGIMKIVFTSSSGASSAARWFTEYLKTRDIIHRFPVQAKPVKSEIEYKGRKIALSVVISPSGRVAGRFTFEGMVEMYKNEITG